MTILQDFKDSAAKLTFGISLPEAHRKGICIVCKKPPQLRTELEKKEYEISGIGGPCWDEIMGKDSE